jgi:hypothetical protein
MHTATHRRRLRSRATFAFSLVLGLSFSVAVFGQDGGGEEKKSIGDQISELVGELETRSAELDELTKKIDKNADRATAVVMEKEVSDRREKYRRDVAKLVELVLSGEDAGAEVAQGRATAARILQAEAPKMREKLKEQGKTIVALLDTVTNGAPEEAAKARKDLVD